MRGPDFFIVGAPKCGTTALTDYLSQHPDVGMCSRKETHFFASDLHPHMALKRPRGSLTLDRYLDFFEQVQGMSRIGEASVWYVYSPGAAREIWRYRQDAQIIVMVRNPAEMIHSLHAELVHQTLEPVTDFESALALDEERQREGTPPGFPPESYRAAVRYGEQLARYVEVFGRERIHTIVYEEFRDDTRSAFRGVCAFLGVDPGFIPAMPVVNASHTTRSRALQRFVRRPPESLRTAVHTVVPQRARHSMGSKLRAWNRKFRPRDPLPSSVARSLASDTEREVVALRELLGLDVSHWLEPSNR